MISEKKTKLILIIICFVQIFYIFHFRSGFEFEVFKNPFKKNSGINFALQENVIEVKNIINKQQIKDFNFSDELISDPYLYQRSIEFNYPIRLKKNSQFIFLSKDEKYNNSCDLIQKGNFVQLIKC